MSVTEMLRDASNGGYLDKVIVIDGESTPIEGTGQSYMSYPVVFPTITYSLVNTDGLTNIVNAIRKQDGHKMEISDYSYESAIGINGYTDDFMDTCIEVAVTDEDASDYGESYIIDLNENDTVRANIRANLDNQLFHLYGKDINTLIKQATERMKR